MSINMYHALLILILYLFFNRGSSVLLTTQPESKYAQLQESVTFRCKVEGSDFNAVDHSPQWFKVQDEEMFVAVANTLIRLEEAVITSLKDRVDISVVHLTDPSGEESVFTINDIIAEDTGKYECRVSNVDGNRTFVAHELHVVENLSSLGIYAADNASVSLSQLMEHPPVQEGSEFEFDSSKQGIIQCVAVANSIEPTVSIYVGREQSSGHYDSTTTCVWEGSSKVLKTKVCTTVRGDNGFMLPGQSSGQVFECKAEVHHKMTPLTTSLTMILKGPPAVISEECPNIVYARVGQENVELSCVLHANPRTDYVGWRVDTSGQDLTAFHSKEGFSTSDTSIGDHRQQIKLTIHEVTSGHFREYTLVLRNSYDETQRKIQLQETGESDAITAGYSVKASLYVTAILAIVGVMWI